MIDKNLEAEVVDFIVSRIPMPGVGGARERMAEIGKSTFYDGLRRLAGARDEEIRIGGQPQRVFVGLGLKSSGQPATRCGKGGRAMTDGQTTKDTKSTKKGGEERP